MRLSFFVKRNVARPFYATSWRLRNTERAFAVPLSVCGSDTAITDETIPIGRGNRIPFNGTLSIQISEETSYYKQPQDY